MLAPGKYQSLRQGGRLRKPPCDMYLARLPPGEFQAGYQEVEGISLGYLQVDGRRMFALAQVLSDLFKDIPRTTISKRMESLRIKSRRCDLRELRTLKAMQSLPSRAVQGSLISREDLAVLCQEARRRRRRAEPAPPLPLPGSKQGTSAGYSSDSDSSMEGSSSGGSDSSADPSSGEEDGGGSSGSDSSDSVQSTRYRQAALPEPDPSLLRLSQHLWARSLQGQAWGVSGRGRGQADCDQGSPGTDSGQGKSRHHKSASGHPRPTPGGHRSAPGHARSALHHPKASSGHAKTSQVDPRSTSGHLDTSAASGHSGCAQTNQKSASGHSRSAQTDQKAASGNSSCAQLDPRASSSAHSKFGQEELRATCGHARFTQADSETGSGHAKSAQAEPRAASEQPRSALTEAVEVDGPAMSPLANPTAGSVNEKAANGQVRSAQAGPKAGSASALPGDVHPRSPVRPAGNLLAVADDPKSAEPHQRLAAGDQLSTQGDLGSSASVSNASSQGILGSENVYRVLVQGDLGSAVKYQASTLVDPGLAVSYHAFVQGVLYDASLQGDLGSADRYHKSLVQESLGPAQEDPRPGSGYHESAVLGDLGADSGYHGSAVQGGLGPVAGYHSSVVQGRHLGPASGYRDSEAPGDLEEIAGQTEPTPAVTDLGLETGILLPEESNSRSLQADVGSPGGGWCASERGLSFSETVREKEQGPLGWVRGLTDAVGQAGLETGPESSTEDSVLSADLYVSLGDVITKSIRADSGSAEGGLAAGCILPSVSENDPGGEGPVVSSGSAAAPQQQSPSQTEGVGWGPTPAPGHQKDSQSPGESAEEDTDCTPPRDEAPCSSPEDSPEPRREHFDRLIRQSKLWCYAKGFSADGKEFRLPLARAPSSKRARSGSTPSKKAFKGSGSERNAAKGRRLTKGSAPARQQSCRKRKSGTTAPAPGRRPFTLLEHFPCTPSLVLGADGDLCPAYSLGAGRSTPAPKPHPVWSWQLGGNAIPLPPSLKFRSFSVLDF